MLIAANLTGKNFTLQNEVIDKVGKEARCDEDIRSEPRAVQPPQSNMVTFNKFSEYISLMSQISDNLRDFANRTASIDNVVNQIDLSLQETTVYPVS